MKVGKRDVLMGVVAGCWVEAVCLRCQLEFFSMVAQTGNVFFLRGSLWPQANFKLLNQNQFIHTCSERENEKHVTPPCFIFMSQQSVSEVPSPMAT